MICVIHPFSFKKSLNRQCPLNIRSRTSSMLHLFPIYRRLVLTGQFFIIVEDSIKEPLLNQFKFFWLQEIWVVSIWSTQLFNTWCELTFRLLMVVLKNGVILVSFVWWLVIGDGLSSSVYVACSLYSCLDSGSLAFRLSPCHQSPVTNHSSIKVLP